MKPRILVVYGDTNPTPAGALAAAKLNIPNVLVGKENNRIVKEVKAKKGRRLLPRKAAIFGDGKASKKIVQIIAKDCC